jgi:hypothetical protein
MKILFHRGRIRSHRGGMADRTRPCVQTQLLLTLLRANELVEEYLRRIHHAGGMPSEQAIDTTDASPIGLLDSTPAGRFSRPLHNAAVEAG